MKKNIAVFASGTGSNFININNEIKKNKINAKICLLISNFWPIKNFANSTTFFLSHTLINAFFNFLSLY